MTIRGSCHCGAIAFSFDETPTKAVDCNCSICRRKGALLMAVDSEAFRLETPREALSTYTFNKDAIQHRFCSTCGCAPFSEGILGGKAMTMINLRCAEVDLAGVEVLKFDGASL